MAKNANSKLKILALRQILEEESDAEQGLTMTELIERLSAFGIAAERKGIYRDIQTLREFGVDIQTLRTKPVQYAIMRRDFSLNQLMLMVDAVQSCRFLTTRQADAITRNLKLLASDRQRAILERSIHVQGRIASKSEGVFETIDLVHEALRERRKIRFLYYRHGLDGQRYATREGRPHVVTPVGIAFSDGFYYLSAWDDEHGDFSEYRIDRMGRAKVTEEAATRNEAIANRPSSQGSHESFGRFGGKPVSVTLIVSRDKIDIILDRFGSDIAFQPHGDDTALVKVNVLISEQFFGWIAGLGTTVRIAGPSKVKSEYTAYLRRLLEAEEEQDGA